MMELGRMPRRWREVLTILHLFVLVVCAPLGAQESATVTGTVRVPSFLRDERPEPDVVVMLVDSSGQSRTAVTDGAGKVWVREYFRRQLHAAHRDAAVRGVRPRGDGRRNSPAPIAKFCSSRRKQNTQDFVAVRDRWRIPFPSGSGTRRTARANSRTCRGADSTRTTRTCSRATFRFMARACS